MSPTLLFVLGLTTLLPQAFSINIPINLAVGLANITSVDNPGDNPLPPSPPGWYPIPDTPLSLRLLPYGPLLPSATAATACLEAAQSDIAATIAAHGDGPLPHPAWTFVHDRVALAASGPFPGLGTYGRLASALTGLRHLITAPGGPGPRQSRWVLSHDVLGIVMSGVMGPEGRVGAGRAGGPEASVVGGATGAGGVASASASATASQSVSIVGVKELVNSS